MMAGVKNRVFGGGRGERLSRALSKFTQNKLSVIGLVIVLTSVLVAVFAPVLAPYPDARSSVDLREGAEPPSLDHPMGTDQNGRDILSRVMYGSQLSLIIGTVIVSLSVVIGLSFGLIAGTLGGIAEAVIMRVVEIFLALPPIVLAMGFIAATEPSLINAVIAISFSWWAWYARLVYGEVLSVKEEGFVEASRAIGATWYRIAFKEILPNISSPIIVKASLDMGIAILVAAALSFIGLGAQPPTPDLGTMVANGRDYITIYWWIATMPGFAIAFVVLGFNLLGNGLRDVLDQEVR